MAEVTQTRPPSGGPGALSATLLPLPDPVGLSEDQRRGAARVWGGEPLTVHTAVDLGVRTTGLSAEPDCGGRWYPRACRSHIAVAANSALQAHVGECEQCVEDITQCATGMALARLTRGRRP
ncbi:hypothetical protein [Streptomyces sp. NPDC057386]|uniref:hypothetical protein n=1 Tax=unclassified Streptomyces TaxID=2593676 RepID=UPI0036449660